MLTLDTEARKDAEELERGQRGTQAERDVATAQRTYPGRRVLLNANNGIEVHPAGHGEPRPLGS